MCRLHPDRENQADQAGGEESTNELDNDELEEDYEY